MHLISLLHAVALASLRKVCDDNQAPCTPQVVSLLISPMHAASASMAKAWQGIGHEILNPNRDVTFLNPHRSRSEGRDLGQIDLRNGVDLGSI